jgi:hypothetical protein
MQGRFFLLTKSLADKKVALGVFMQQICKKHNFAY